MFVYQNIICIFICLQTALQALQKFYPDGETFFIYLLSVIIQKSVNREELHFVSPRTTILNRKNKF